MQTLNYKLMRFVILTTETTSKKVCETTFRFI